MKPEEKREFGELLMGLLELYGRQVTPSAAGLWWGAFERYPLAEVRTAFSRYTQDPEQGRYPPTPAAVIACLPSQTTTARLTADEAWAQALAVFDETASVCTTDEILEAVASASPVWELGDKIGARMAFKSAYERITSDRRLSGIAPTWRLSLGWDVARRERVVLEAMDRGLITQTQAQQHLPPPEPVGPAAAIAGLLTGASNVVEFPGDAKARAHLARLREALAAGQDGRREQDPVAERESFERKRQEAMDAVARMQAERGGCDGAAGLGIDV